MAKWYLLWGVLTVAALALIGFGAWILTLPSGSEDAAARPITQAETDAMLASLKPPKRQRPLIAIVGVNDATETLDYLMPTGILRRADIADVVMLATAQGPVRLFPVLKVQPDATIADFDAAHPEGADYVIVPAMSRDDDPAVLAWLRKQASTGAKIIAVCAGAKVAAAAGLLDGHRATTHWYYLRELLKRSPSIRYVADRRMVSDGEITTTTGITASMPMMLTLIEAIAGRAKAESVADDLGVGHWDARHASGAFKFTRPFATTVLSNRMAFWDHEALGLHLAPGMDEVSLALVADAWSRTYRSTTTTFAAAAEPVETRNGIRIIPDTEASDWPDALTIGAHAESKPVVALDQTLQAITTRYGDPTTNIVAMQLEYPRSSAAP